MHCKALDGLRGYAAISVIMFHSILHYNTAYWGTFATNPMQSLLASDSFAFTVLVSIFNGSTPVVIFFILSGYVLSASFKKYNDNFASNYFSFLIKRMLRIYPAVVSCCLITFLVIRSIYEMGFSSQSSSFSSLIYNSLLFKNDLLGISWTLTIEVAVAFIIFPIYFASKKLGGIALIFALIYSIISINAPSLALWIPLLNLSLISFVCGMMLDTEQAKIIFDGTERYWLVVCVGIVSIGRVYSEWSTLFIILQVLLCSCLIGILRYGSESKLKTLLESRVSLAIGRLSFSIYLYAAPVSWAFFSIFRYNGEHSLTIGLLYGIIVFLITIPLSIVSYRFIELPCINMSKRLGELLTN
ncbi:acyltransferase family protein [Rahnella laticis]|uniref:acyltransferase family protein n=1 Tax=Rahnella laticis TaxID=2787622 RepID=UPI0018A292FF|nr:acyltransferase [Rahnella laticis]MBF7994085.1 acyltransferase [Rahnella laticis]